MSTIDPKVHQVLDGELPREALTPAQLAELQAMEQVAALLVTEPAASVAPRVMTAVRRRPPTLAVRVRQWLTERHVITVNFRPVWSLAIAAALALIALLPLRGPGPTLGAEEGVVQFVGRFPGAKTVEVVGSFNDWRAGTLVLRDDDHDGVWRGSVVLPVGEHEYMFVVDGERWVTDPLAGRYVADGFGRQNAFLIVRPAVR
jgi:hypothetical protein